MAGFVEVPGGNELKSGEMRMFRLHGGEILLARVGDAFYAADNRCPHLGGNLSAGKLDGTIVTCPWHHSQYDLTDGRVVRWTDWSGIKLSLANLFKPPHLLKTHRIRVEGGKILMETDD